MGTFTDMILQAWKIEVTCKPLFYQGRGLSKNKIARLDFEKSAVCIGFVVIPQKRSTVHRTVLLFFMFSFSCSFLFGQAEGYRTISSVPMPIRTQPITEFTVNFSCRKTKASTRVMTTLSLSIGTTLETSPICRA